MHLRVRKFQLNVKNKYLKVQKLEFHQIRKQNSGISSELF